MSHAAKKIQLGEVRSSQQGFSRLAQLAATLEPYLFDNVEIDFSLCSWFDANMCAPLGVVLAHTIDNINTIKLTGLPSKIQAILSKNRFLTAFASALI